MVETAKFSTKLVQKNQLTRDVIELRFEKPAGCTYQAGQFMQWIIPKDGKNVLRAYSLSSCPIDKTLNFCVKILPNGTASKIAKNLKVGDSLEMQGPRGRFVCNEAKPTQFVATGVGLAPIIGIIRDELESKFNTEKISLIFGVRHKEDLFWTDLLDELKSKFTNFDYHVTLSRPEETDWVGLHGRVTDHIQKNTSSQYFLCGSPNMVTEVKNILQEQSQDPKDIHFEIF
jgi:ferredoxin-NADP reductase